jgi:anti-anti-sigma factor
MDFEIAMRLAPPLAQLTLRGELDVSTAEKVGMAVDQAIARNCGLVTFDLQEVTFTDCSGIGALVGAHQRLDEVASHMRVVGVSPRVSRMMKLTDTESLPGVADLVTH